MANPGTVSQGQIDALQEGMKDLTSLGQQLSKTFRDINRETDVLGNSFKGLIVAAQNNNDLASKYLISQKLQEATQNRINEIKAKSSYLDSVGLEFKREETQLQAAIASAQIKALDSAVSIGNINKAERERAIASLKVQNVLRATELEYFETNSNLNSKVLGDLNNQLNTIEGFAPNLQESNKLAKQMKNIFGDTLSSMGDFGKILSSSFQSVVPTSKDILDMIIAKGVKMYIEFDKAGFTLRKTFGFLRGDFDVLEKNIKEIAIDLADFGVTFESAAIATSAIGKEFNALVASNKSIVKDVTMLSAQLGIAESESAKFLKTISSISGNTVSSQKGMTGFAKQMSNAAGVALPDVMKEIAESSDDIRIYTGKSVVNLIKGTVEAKQMGTSFVKMVDTAKKLLDFNVSINDEMEASVLLGRDINFQRARELAFRKNVIDANREILRIAQSMDFDAMDPFQAESFAKASGKTVAELQDMIQAEKEIQHIRLFGTAEQKKQLSMMDELKKKRENEAKDIGKQAEARLMQEANQERMNQLQNQFNKLMMELAKPVMDVVEPLLKLATVILPPFLRIVVPIAGIFEGISRLFIKMSPYVLSLVAGIEAMALTGNKFFGGLSTGISYFLTAGEKIQSIFGTVSGFFSKLPLIGSYFSKFGGFLGTFGKFLGPIGLVVNAFQAISGFIDGFSKTEGNFFEKVWGGLVGGLKAVVQPIFDLLMWPINAFKKWFMNDSGMAANSPSEIGLAILHGIKSIGAALLDAITAPFRQGFNFISGYFGGPKLPSFSDMIGDKPVTNTEPIKNQTETSTSIIDSNKRVVDKLDELIGLMKSGGIAVNMDGSKVSTALGVATKFRGAY
jgi:hypothetical protein